MHKTRRSSFKYTQVLNKMVKEQAKKTQNVGERYYGEETVMWFIEIIEI